VPPDMDIHSVFARSLLSGTVAGLAVAATAAAFGRRATGSAVAPINATSHVIWGDYAARNQNGVSTRGWELRMPRRSLAGIYAPLGLSLAVAGLLEQRRSGGRSLQLTQHGPTGVAVTR
jgi:hypothetical protein